MNGDQNPPEYLGAAHVASSGQELAYQRRVAGALGLRNLEWLQEPSDFPVGAEGRAIMRQCNAIVEVGKYYGMLPEVQGMLACIALTVDLFEVREAAYYTIDRVNPVLAALVVRTAISDPDPTIRVDSLCYLAAEHPAEARYMATWCAMHDREDWVRIQALEVLLDIDTEEALSIGRGMLKQESIAPKLRSYCEAMLSRNDLVPVDFSERGNRVTEATSQQAMIVAAVLYQSSIDVRLTSARQCFDFGDTALSIGLGLAMAIQPETELSKMGLAEVKHINEAVAEWGELLIGDLRR